MCVPTREAAFNCDSLCDRIPRKKMKATRIAVSALYFTIFITAAASATKKQYFYNSENVSATFTTCDEETSRTFSKTYCAAKCAAVSCYRFFWENGVCNIERRRASQSSKNYYFQLKRV